ncbi:hypothetical protein [Aeromicrobium endophyticum]|uniref:hypothetical protein n=1 Tax=Aeromicrobium endophyticum TaxID=2292704 RepID=UPI001314E921|nr:hypothetical protein [Aeromicrobium endophyticum]
MHISLVIFGVTVLELSVSDGASEAPEHIEDHTGYRVGFEAPPAVPDALGLPQRDL